MRSRASALSSRNARRAGAANERKDHATQYQTPSRGGGPHTVVITDDGVIWFTLQNGDKIGRLDTKGSGQITEYNTSGGPYGLALDNGKLWYMGSHNGRLGVVE